MKKRIVVLLALVILLSGTTATSAAWLIHATPPIKNSFTPAAVMCEVREDLAGAEKKDVCIENTGNTDAYIRAAIIVSWTDVQGSVYAAGPANGDYTMDLKLDNWFKASDGYYYYPLPVAAYGGCTDYLINSCTYEKNAPDGFTLQVTVLAEAIQSAGVDSEGTPVVQTAWKAVTVGSDGQLSEKEG